MNFPSLTSRALPSTLFSGTAAIVLSFAAAGNPAVAATFTVGDNTPGPFVFINSRGQSFTPSIPGTAGTGSAGLGATVLLRSFTFDRGLVHNPNLGAIAPTLRIYRSLPTLAQLNGGFGDVAGTSTGFEVSGAQVTYQFSNVPLNRTQEYFALFSLDQALRNTGGNTYLGGFAYGLEPGASELFTSDTDRLFNATFETAPAIPSPALLPGLVGFGIALRKRGSK